MQPESIEVFEEKNLKNSLIRKKPKISIMEEDNTWMIMLKQQ